MILDWFYDTLPLWMFAALFVFLMLGYPVAFSIGGVAMAFGFLYLGLDDFNLLPGRIFDIIQKSILLAVPLFIFMGVTLERAGIAEDLLETMSLLLGRIKGGLALSVVLVGALLAASTGIVGATTVTMGLLALPTMLRRGVSPRLATGTIAAAGTLGQIIPPSIVLVILGDIMGVPVGDLFMGAVIPGLLLVALYMAYVVLVGTFFPKSAPPVSREELSTLAPGELTARVMKSLLPPMVLILVVLGSILTGVAAPTEAAALGALAALGLARVNKKLNRPMLEQVMRTTTRLTSMVFVIMVAASLFSLVFRDLDGDLLVRESFTGLGVSRWSVLALVMLGLFLAGFFLDFIEITFIFVPVVAPLMVHLGFDPLWFAILVAINLQTSFLTPPFGYSLFYLKSVAPDVDTRDIYLGVIPFVAVQLLGLGLVMVFPQMVLWLPRVLFG